MGVTVNSYESARLFGRNVSSPPSSPKSNKPTETGGKLSKVSLFGLMFDPEYGGDIFLRNVGFSPNYTALCNPAVGLTNS
jgi:hypothetical protein